MNRRLNRVAVTPTTLPMITRNQLLDGVWGYDSESGEDTVKTHISRLRNKLRDIPEFRIVTIKGLGYKAEITKEEGA